MNLADAIDIRLGGSSVQEVRLGAVKIWPTAAQLWTPDDLGADLLAHVQMSELAGAPGSAITPGDIPDTKGNTWFNVWPGTATVSAETLAGRKTAVAPTSQAQYFGFTPSAMTADCSAYAVVRYPATNEPRVAALQRNASTYHAWAAGVSNYPYTPLLTYNAVREGHAWAATYGAATDTGLWTVVELRVIGGVRAEVVCHDELAGNLSWVEGPAVSGATAHDIAVSGPYAEAVFVKRLLTSAERAKMFAYLSHRHQITANMTPGHAWKETPPTV